jgi:hypothetical protein
MGGVAFSAAENFNTFGIKGVVGVILPHIHRQ